jgi:hypothetical protein
MQRSRRRSLRLSLISALVFSQAQPAFAESIPTWQLVPLAVRNGHCEIVLPTPDSNEKYYLIVGSLACSPGPFPVRIHTQTCDRPVSLVQENTPPTTAWSERVRELAQRLCQARQNNRVESRYASRAEPLMQRHFHLFIQDRGFDNPQSYVSIAAEARAVGRHCQVYVDKARAMDRDLQSTIEDAVRCFDDEVYPYAQTRLGRALDVDRNGRFTLLFTGILNKLVKNGDTLDGFVRGSDFCRDLAAPFGNRCAMMYLNANLKAGPYLRAVIAHEYTHAVVFSEHVFGKYLAEFPATDEESWLNEALAHLAEDQLGYGWSNLDYRISAFLNNPEKYSLVVADYYGSGLWRTPGTRGASYLFLRWCVDACGSDLLTHLIQSNLTGINNLEVATQESFPRLFREWTAALALGRMNLPGTGVRPLNHIDLRNRLGTQLLSGPRFCEIAFAHGNQEVQLAGTAAAYFLLRSPGGSCSLVTIDAEPHAEIQVSLIRLPKEAAQAFLTPP